MNRYLVFELFSKFRVVPSFASGMGIAPSEAGGWNIKIDLFL